MVFVKLTLNYLRKNFLYLCVFAIVPSVLYGLNDSSLNVLTFFKKIRDGKASFNFAGVYKNFSLMNYSNPLISILTLLSVIFFAAVSAAFIEKHMRIGKKSFKGLILALNDNIMPFFYFMVLFSAFYEIWSVILSAVIITVSLITPPAAMYGAGIFIVLIFYAGFFSALGPFLTWLPCKLITGFSLGEAFAYSISLMPGKIRSIISIALPYGLAMLFSAAAQMLFGVAAGFAVRIVSFLFCFTYYTVLIFVAYFEMTNEPREDLKRKYF